MDKKGLSASEAKLKLAETGPNELPSKKTYSVLKLLSAQFKNLLIWLLIFASLLSFLVGHATDSMLILVILALNAGLGFWQEFKASKELEALRKLEVAFSRVIRDGKQIQLSSKEIVPGDLVVLEAGDKIPADGKLVQSFEMYVNESALTGESLPVVKTAEKEENELFFGTNISSGRGTLLVEKTGVNTRFGKIALTLSEVEEENSTHKHTSHVAGTERPHLLYSSHNTSAAPTQHNNVTTTFTTHNFDFNLGKDAARTTAADDARTRQLPPLGQGPRPGVERLGLPGLRAALAQQEGGGEDRREEGPLRGEAEGAQPGDRHPAEPPGPPQHYPAPRRLRGRGSRLPRLRAQVVRPLHLHPQEPPALRGDHPRHLQADRRRRRVLPQQQGRPPRSQDRERARR